MQSQLSPVKLPLEIDNSKGSIRSDRSVMYLLYIVLALALGLRLWGIGFGLPYDFTPDEVHEILRAFKLGAGEYTFHSGKGGLYYFLFVEYGFLYVFWWITGHVSNPNEFALLYLQDPTVFYLAGRVTVAIMGTATCLVVFLIGQRLYDWRIGLAASLIGATAHYHGLWSHYINVDIGLTLAVWASVLAYLEYERNNQKRWLIGAGVLGGVALAFKLTGAIVAIPLLLAIATRSGNWLSPRPIIKDGGIFLLAMVITCSAVAPENIAGFAGGIKGQFSNIISSANAADVGSAILVESNEFDEAVNDITILHERGYLPILAKGTNVAITLAALLGAVLGIWRRNRWDMIWGMLAVLFIGIMELSDRGGEERYLLPILPGLWLLAARGAAAIAGQRERLLAIITAIIITIPLLTLIRDDYMLTRPDTRVLAKDWIETNIPQNSKILMDGMRYRFIHSPPLNPDDSTVARRATRAEEAEYVSRGVSKNTLSLYAKAMSQIEGPKYDLHSTNWGLAVKDLTHYQKECFDYIITSSTISRRFDNPSNAERYPKSAQFYRRLSTEAGFEVIYSVAPVPWKTQGPSITVYSVPSRCE
jgi:4-amino-4-deoxy-L-arabinose transferase-like glycosyltransferase